MLTPPPPPPPLPLEPAPVALLLKLLILQPMLLLPTSLARAWWALAPPWLGVGQRWKPAWI